MEEILREYWKGRKYGKPTREYLFPFIRVLRDKIEALGWENHEIVLLGVGRDSRPILNLLEHENFFKDVPKHLLPISRGHVVVETLTQKTDIRRRLKMGDIDVAHALRKTMEQLMKEDPGFKMEVERIGNVLRRISGDRNRLLVLIDSGHLGTQPLLLQAIADMYEIPSITAILYVYPEHVKNAHDVVGTVLRTELEKKNAVDLWERFPKFTQPTHTTQYKKKENFEAQLAKYVARMAGIIYEVYGKRAAQAWLRKYFPYWKDGKIQAAMRHLIQIHAHP